MNPSSNSNQFRDFLLDRLPQEQAEAIEERMFQDEAYFSDVQDAEDELIEEYVLGALDSTEEKIFAARVERAPELQERVALRRALVRALQGVRAAAPVAAEPSRRKMWGRFLVPGFAVAILVLFFAAYRAEHRNHAPSQTAGTAGTSEGPAEGQIAEAQAAAVLFLPAHVARGAAERPSVLHIGSARLVKLELETPGGDESTRWDVRLTSGGAQVFSAAGLASQQAGLISYVVAQVPAPQLPPKDYQISLSPEAPGSAGTSTWDVRVVP